MLLPRLLTGFLRGGVGQHLLYQPDIRPGEPLGGRVARDPGRGEPDPDSYAHLRKTSEEGETSGDPSHVPSRRAVWAGGFLIRYFSFPSFSELLQP